MILKHSTIDGGAGNDRISLNSYAHHNVIRYYSGEGNDIVYNLGATDTVSIVGGTYTRSTVGNDVVLGVGSGSITVKNARYKTVNVAGTLAGGGGNVKRNTTPSTVVYGTSYNDSIYNSSTGNYATIYAGAGNDSITNYGDTVSIAGGYGNDFIYSYSYYSTIDGGAGNDRISLNSNAHHNVIRYYSGEGNDIVYNLGATDTVSIVGGTYTRSTVGSDVVLRVGSGSITLKNSRYKSFNVESSSSYSNVMEDLISEETPVLSRNNSSNANVMEDLVSEETPILSRNNSNYANVVDDWISEETPTISRENSQLSELVNSNLTNSADVLDSSLNLTSLTQKNNNLITFSGKK